jgi:PHD/YefM family antitoxin component YafN of YafNO toxin-antitoxin module
MFDYLEDRDQELESLLETLEILQDEELMQAIREGFRAIENGETIPRNIF